MNMNNCLVGRRNDRIKPVEGCDLRLIPHVVDCGPDLVDKLGKLRRRVPAFLEIKVRTALKGFDSDLFPAPAGKQNKRDGFIYSPYLF